MPRYQEVRRIGERLVALTRDTVNTEKRSRH